MCAERNSDIWQAPAASAGPDGRRIAIRIVPFDQPLGQQLGVDPKLTIPPELARPLFGEPAPLPAERDIAAPAAPPPMRTYALLDAAKVPNLADLIANSGLEHGCLFKGKLAAELGDVAPWLVRLEPQSRFTRNLFTAGKMPGALWDKRPGVLIRSRAAFQPLWGYLRKFTRLQDEAGKWFYFRFWEPDFLEAAQSILDELDTSIQREAVYPLTFIAFRPGGAG